MKKTVGEYSVLSESVTVGDRQKEPLANHFGVAAANWLPAYRR